MMMVNTTISMFAAMLFGANVTNASPADQSGVSRPNSRVVAVRAANADAKKYGYSRRYGKLTPNQVFGLAVRLNEAFLASPQVRQSDGFQRLKAISPATITGKTPEDVFVALGNLADVVDRLRESANMGIKTRIKREKEKAIPAEVYLAVGTCLDGVVGWIAAKNPDRAWGELYRVQTYTGKTPSDVFAQIQAATRRIARYLDPKASPK